MFRVLVNTIIDMGICSLSRSEMEMGTQPEMEMETALTLHCVLLETLATAGSTSRTELAVCPFSSGLYLHCEPLEC